VFFSRYYTHSLPYDANYIRQRYIEGSISSSSSTSTSTSSSSSSSRSKLSVLLCPSFGANSMLSAPAMINAMIELVQEQKQRARSLASGGSDGGVREIVFTLKVHQSLHPSTGEQERLHPLMWISELERQQVALLAQYIQLADVDHYNILPFMEAHDVVRHRMLAIEKAKALRSSCHGALST